MNLKFRSSKLDDMSGFIQAVAYLIKPGQVITFSAPMGAGKTTFISMLSRCLGVSDLASSPTFSIVNEYHGDVKIHHFDCYRLEDIAEAYDMGMEEYFDSDSVVFIEWPDIAEELLPEHWKMKIYLNDDGSRSYDLQF